MGVIQPSQLALDFPNVKKKKKKNIAQQLRCGEMEAPETELPTYLRHRHGTIQEKDQRGKPLATSLVASLTECCNGDDKICKSYRDGLAPEILN